MCPQISIGLFPSYTALTRTLLMFCQYQTFSLRQLQVLHRGSVLCKPLSLKPKMLLEIYIELSQEKNFIWFLNLRITGIFLHSESFQCSSEMAEVEGVCSVGMEYESTAVICRPAESMYCFIRINKIIFCLAWEKS